MADDYCVVLTRGPLAGSEAIGEDGRPWRGDLPNARALVALMEFGHDHGTFMVWRLTAATPCVCGHVWSQHDAYGCQFDDGCKGDGDG